MGNGWDGILPADRASLRRLLEEVRGGGDIEVALEQLARLPYENLGDARVDHHRAIRQGLPEVVFGEGKTPDQMIAILRSLLTHSPRALATRVDEEAAVRVGSALPELNYYPSARMLIADREPLPRTPGVVVLSAGTSDVPVAEEAALTSETMGNTVQRFYDVGVAGIHRLFGVLPQMREARVIVVVAGMEGALPSVVAGLVEAPVVAVPTSVGYGASFGGLAALLAMLNSCAAGVSVVNIDNGFGAGVVASLINRERR